MPRRAILLLVTCLLVGCGGAVPPASAAERAQVPVTLYTTRWCPVCAHARGWLRARGVPFVERDVESDRAAAARWRQLNRAGTVPVADVDGRVLVGGGLNFIFDLEVWTPEDQMERRPPPFVTVNVERAGEVIAMGDSFLANWPLPLGGQVEIEVPCRAADRCTP